MSTQAGSDQLCSGQDVVNSCAASRGRGRGSGCTLTSHADSKDANRDSGAQQHLLASGSGVDVLPVDVIRNQGADSYELC